MASTGTGRDSQQMETAMSPPSTVDILQPTPYVQLFYNEQEDSLATMLVEGHPTTLSNSECSFSSESSGEKELSISSKSEDDIESISFDIVSWQLSDLSSSSGPTVWLDSHWYQDKDESLDRTLLLGEYDYYDDDMSSSVSEEEACGRLFRQCSPFGHYNKRGKPYYYRTTRSCTERDARRNLQPHRLTGGSFSYSVLQE